MIDKTYKAYCKINLGLEVLNKRPDGYHEISTIFCKIGLADIITIKTANQLTFNCDTNLNIPNEENIAFKAIKLFQQETNIKEIALDISLSKKIPSGAGLGGGSSDAATILCALNEIYQHPIDNKKLHNLGLYLGSDVPFFLNQNKFSYASGRGEILTPIDISFQYFVLIVNPGINVSTKLAYQSLNRSNQIVSSTDLVDNLNKSITNPSLFPELIKNDFEIPIFEKNPKLLNIKELLYESGAVFALMSGSGSTLFGLFDNLSTALAAKNKFSSYFTFLDQNP